MSECPIDEGIFALHRHAGETFPQMLERLDLEMRDRNALASMLCISRRTLYRIMEKCRIREYRRRA